MYECNKIVDLINQNKHLLNPNTKFYNVSNIILSCNLTDRQRHIVLSYQNKSLEEIAKDYGLTRERIRQQLHKSIKIVRQYIQDNNLNEYGLTSYIEGYNRIIDRINDLNIMLPILNVDNYNIGKATLDFIFAIVLNDRSHNCIKHYFVEEQSLRSIGANYNLSPERIRQIIAKSIRDIRRYLVIHKITSYSTVLTDNNYFNLLQNNAHVITKLQEEIAMYKDEVNNLRNIINQKANSPENTAESNYCFYKRNERGYVIDSIFSVRTTNALIRKNLNTINDIVNLTPDELKKIRNLGKKSIAEVVQVLKDKFKIDYYKLHGVVNE
mgnify:CR=1 FL=1